MTSVARRFVLSFLISLLVISAAGQSAYAWGKKKPKPAKNSNPIVEFIRENGVDLDKPVICVRITGSVSTGDGPRAIMKVYAIKEIRKERRETANDKSLRELVDVMNAANAEIITRFITFIREGDVIDAGKTTKVGTLEVFMKDGSSFVVNVGEDFSQIIFEKIIEKPENPFSSEPVKKERKVLSFVSPELTKAVKLILSPQEKPE